MTESAYVAGPMTNRPNFNFPAFDAVAMVLRRNQGWIVHNPHEHDQATFPGIDQAEATKTGDVAALGEEIGFTMSGALAWDLARVAESDHLVMLPEWWLSTGAKIERFTAEQTGSRIWLAVHSWNTGWYIVLDPIQKRMAASHVEVADEWCGVPPLHHRDPEPVLAAMRRVEGEDIEALERTALDFDWVDDHRNVNGTTIQTSSTGGQKGAKSTELDRIPQAALRAVAEHFNQGSVKYPDPAPGVANWTLGYDWSLCINALGRHLSAWQSGEDLDPEFGTSHLRAVAWHALVLLEFEIQGWGTDDRRIPSRRDEYVAEKNGV